MMQNRFHHIALLPLSLFTLLLLLGSCGDVIHSSHNGDLDGYWQMTALDSLATGTSADVLEQQNYLAVQGSILEVKSLARGGSYLFRFNHTGDSLLLYDARYNNRSGGDSLLHDVSRLERFGFTRLDEHFHVDQLSGSRLVLSNPRYRLHFRKY